MTNESAKRIRRLLGIALSISIVIAGLCLMAACVGIYRSGDRAFSREAVAAAFSPIALPVYLCMGLAVLNGLLVAVLPGEKEKRPAPRQTEMRLEQLQRKADLESCDQALRTRILELRRSRKTLLLITLALLAMGSVIFLIYALQADAFHQSQINDSMIRAMAVLVPCMAVPFGFGIFAARRSLTSMKQETELLKQAPKKADAAASLPGRSYVIRNVIIIAAIVLLIYGFFTGGTADVLTKAVNICTECVGLG